VTIILTHGTMLHTPRNIINTLFFIFVSTVWSSWKVAMLQVGTR
jgi:hypothetical protein